MFYVLSGHRNDCPLWTETKEEKNMRNERKDRQRIKEEKAAEELFKKVHLGIG